tara:strand:+ start:1622 stop:2842 length:1221 start_codon:yes stop_codon:yes gene_type:complete
METKNALKRLRTFQRSLEVYHNNFITKKIKKKSALVSSAESLLSDIDVLFSRTNYPQLAAVRKHLKVIQTTLKSLIKVLSSEVSYAEVYRIFTGNLNDRIQNLGALIEDVDLEDGQSEIEHLDNTRTAFTRMRSKFSSKLKVRPREGSVSVAQVPILAQLNPHLNKPKLLKEIGIPFKTFGLERKTRDIGLVIEDQYLVMFNKEEALAAARESEKESTKASTGHLAKQRRNAQKELRETYRKFAQTCGFTTKAEIDDIVSELVKIKTDDVEKTLSTMFKRALSRELQRELVDVLKETTSTILRLRASVAKLDDSMKPIKAVGRKRQRDIDRTSTVLINTVNTVLRSLEDQAGTKMQLLTDEYILNPENPKLIMFWIVTDDVYRSLAAFSSGDRIVTRWGLPWASKR